MWRPHSCTRQPVLVLRCSTGSVVGGSDGRVDKHASLGTGCRQKAKLAIQRAGVERRQLFGLVGSKASLNCTAVCGSPTYIAGPLTHLYALLCEKFGTLITLPHSPLEQLESLIASPGRYERSYGIYYILVWGWKTTDFNGPLLEVAIFRPQVGVDSTGRTHDLCNYPTSPCL